MTSRWGSYARACCWVLLIAFLAGCTHFGPRTVARDRFDYTEAIHRSRNEQMLRNIVAMRYFQVPEFLTVSSVIAGYSYQAGVGIRGQAGVDGFDESFVGGSGNLNYIERPTITYTPLAGADFTARMLQNIPLKVILYLGASGWPSDVLFRIALERIGAAENMDFYSQSDAGIGQAEQLQRFDRVVDLLIELSRKGAYHVEQVDDQTTVLAFSAEVPADLRALARELKQLLGLDPERDTFHVVDGILLPHTDALRVQTRSLIGIMTFLARGVEVPEVDTAANRVLPLPIEVQRAVHDRAQMRILSAKERPEDPHVAIRYRDWWFYIDGADHRSKRTFVTILVLFELQAPSGSSGAPLLTVPTR